MKISILKYTYLLLLSLLSLVGAMAQSEVSRNKSRLNIGKKPMFMLTNVYKPSTDRLTVKSSTAINAYYRSLMATPSLASTTTTTETKSRTNTEVATHAETASTQAELVKAEDFFFASDKIKVRNAFPNPANDYAQIDYSVMGSNSVRVSLYNVLGVHVSDYDLDKGDHSVRIQTRELPTGVYFYQLLLDGKKVATKKLLIRH